jgi:hypothetical protein
MKNDTEKRQSYQETKKASHKIQDGEVMKNPQTTRLPACSFQPDAPEPQKALIQMRINEYQPTHIPATMQGCNMDNVSVM